MLVYAALQACISVKRCLAGHECLAAPASLRLSRHSDASIDEHMQLLSKTLRRGGSSSQCWVSRVHLTRARGMCYQNSPWLLMNVLDIRRRILLHRRPWLAAATKRHFPPTRYCRSAIIFSQGPSGPHVPLEGNAVSALMSLIRLGYLFPSSMSGRPLRRQWEFAKVMSLASPVISLQRPST